MAPRPILRALAVPLLLGAVVTASASSWTTVRVHRGDTLTAIAGRYHTTVKALIALNHLPGNGNLIYAGQTLRVPAPKRAAAPTSSYVVRAGDTVSSIAARHSTTVSWLAAHNRFGRGYTIYIGARVTVPGRAPSSGPSSFAGRTYPAAVVAAANRDRAWLARHPGPGRDAVRRLIVAAAHRYGVDPALALAISAQEAGFQQRVVSPAHAIGAMQVLPSTGDYVSRYLVHRRLNLLKASDNVTAGVALLAMLTKATSNDGIAVAGYYQGLGSVRAHGLYADTKSYVRNVMALRVRYR
jgi:LysM repeat protein